MFGGNFLEKLKQFSGRWSKMDCLYKKRCSNLLFASYNSCILINSCIYNYCRLRLKSPAIWNALFKFSVWSENPTNILQMFPFDYWEFVLSINWIHWVALLLSCKSSTSFDSTSLNFIYKFKHNSLLSEF